MSPICASLGKVTERQGACPQCGEHRTPNVYHTIDGTEPFLDRTLAELGVPLWDVLGGRCGMTQAFYEFSGDRAAVLVTIVISRTPKMKFAMPDKPDRVDVTQLAGARLARRPRFLGAQGKQAFRVYFDRAIHERMAAHAAEKLALEICGVLVGQWQRDEDGPFVLVNEAIRADKAVSNAGDVTFTHDAWNAVNREMDTKYTDRKIVGWYHSHPNFGIFLSDRDCFIHEHFFNSPGQVAYVVDPVNGVEGVFCLGGTARRSSSRTFGSATRSHLSSCKAAERQAVVRRRRRTCRPRPLPARHEAPQCRPSRCSPCCWPSHVRCCWAICWAA